jgi:ABC-type Zn2+ transport system substrate-binding protein/surface adhesin
MDFITSSVRKSTRSIKRTGIPQALTSVKASRSVRNSPIGDIVTNQYVLYAVLVLAVIHAIRYLSVNNYRSLLLFVLSSMAISHFTKNMVLVLLGGILFVNVMDSVRIRFTREGMKGKKDHDDKDDHEEHDDDDKDDHEEHDNNNHDDDELKVDTKETLKSMVDEVVPKKASNKIKDESKEMLKTLETLSPVLEKMSFMMDKAEGLTSKISGMQGLLGK